MSTPDVDRLDAAVARLHTTIELWEGSDFAEDSLCPGWSRAHVVAHVSANARAMKRAIDGVIAGQPTPFYASDEARDAEINDHSCLSPDDLRRELMEAEAALREALVQLHGFVRGRDAILDAPIVERTPGGVSFEAMELPLLHLREVELHHVDLLSWYTCRTMPNDVTNLLLSLELERARQAGRPIDDPHLLDLPAASKLARLSNRVAPDN